MRAVTIVFDLDGTLVDTAPDLINATNHVLDLLSAPHVTHDVARNWISHGARYMINEALKYAQIQKTEIETDKLLENFLAHYTQNIAKHSAPFPAARETINNLAESGFKLAVCTNKREGLARQLLDKLRLTEKFDAIAGRDTFPMCKPDPRHITKTVELARGNTQHAIMVGDSANDIDAAKRASLPSVAVTFGYSKTPAIELGADAVIDHMSQLQTALIPLVERLVPYRDSDHSNERL